MVNARVLLTNDNTEKTKKLVNALYSSGMNTSLCNKNGAALLEAMPAINPDVIIMDAFMPHIDAEGVLARLNNVDPVKRPLVFVLTSIDNKEMQKTLLRAGADYCFVKPIDSALVAERIVQILSWSGAGCFEGFKPNQDLAYDANLVLRQIGVPANLKGCRYLRDAICLAVENPVVVNNVMTAVYPHIAQKYNSDALSVERAMRYAIKQAWDNGGMSVLKSCFGYAEKITKKPTNSELITNIANDLRFKRKMHMAAECPYKPANML